MLLLNQRISDHPDLLRQRAIERRIKFNIGISEEDFPVNKNYIEQLKQLGVDIIGTSKWFNCALINPNSQDIMTAIEQLEFVEKIVQIDSYNTDSSDLPFDDSYYKWDNPIHKSTKSEFIPTDSEYGLDCNSKT